MTYHRRIAAALALLTLSTLAGHGPAHAEPTGSILSWGALVAVETSQLENLGEVAAGGQHSLGLAQDEDEGFSELAAWEVVAGQEPAPDVRRDLELAWIAAKHGKSNAIVVVRGEATLGCGFGQMSRVDSVRLALRKAAEQELDLADAVAASDGFFPFADGVEELARAGVRTLLAPGGSVRDQEVAEAARALGITLILASRRHFNH